MGKLVIFSAPSGSGKSTIVNYLLTKPELNLNFSISATSRLPRGEEIDGREYYFLSPEEFRQRIANDEFVEYEEVYADKYYGTLRSEIQRIFDNGGNVIFDVDVVGGCNLKKIFDNQALSVFIMPPSIDELRSRLTQRGTDTSEVIDVRVQKAKLEMGYAPKFDLSILNDNLDDAKEETYLAIKKFLNS
jgi:guanylate kinase